MELVLECFTLCQADCKWDGPVGKEVSLVFNDHGLHVEDLFYLNVHIDDSSLIEKADEVSKSNLEATCSACVSCLEQHANFLILHSFQFFSTAYRNVFPNIPKKLWRKIGILKSFDAVTRAAGI